MRIISYSDVITNSSTEVFINYGPYTKKWVEDVVNECIKALGVDKTFDDMFKFEWTFDLDTCANTFGDEFSDEELEQKAKEDPYACWSNDYGLDKSIIDGFKLIPKDENYKKLGKVLESITNSLDFVAYEDR